MWPAADTKKGCNHICKSTRGIWALKLDHWCCMRWPLQYQRFSVWMIKICTVIARRSMAALLKMPCGVWDVLSVFVTVPPPPPISAKHPASCSVWVSVFMCQCAEQLAPLSEISGFDGFLDEEEEEEEDASFILASSATKTGVRFLTTASKSDCPDREWISKRKKTDIQCKKFSKILWLQPVFFSKSKLNTVPCQIFTSYLYILLHRNL